MGRYDDAIDRAWEFGVLALLVFFAVLMVGAVRGWW